MVIEPGQRGLEGAEDAVALDALAAAAAKLGEGGPLEETLDTLVDSAARACGADAVILWSVDLAGRCVVARAVAAPAALAAELEGSRFPLEKLPQREVDKLDSLPEPLRRAAARAGASAVLLIPVARGGTLLGTLELMRRRDRFAPAQRAVARVAAAHAGLALAARGPLDGANGRTVDAGEALRLAGDALAAGPDEARVADQVVVLAAEAAGASAAAVWRLHDAAPPALVAAFGLGAGDPVDALAKAAAGALAQRQSLALEPLGDRAALTLQLGEPPLGALQLVFDAGAEPTDAVVRTLSTFAARAAHALRTNEHARRQSVELERTRALLGVVGQAIAQLSLAHTLETATARVAELLDVDRVAVYLIDPDEERLLPAAGRDLAGPHVRVAERLRELALGPGRGLGVLVVEDAKRDGRLAVAREALAEAGIEAAIGVPLVVHGDVIGLLALYPNRGRRVTADESALVSALAAQLAVAVQNARLHERTKKLGEEREQALQAERQAAKTLRALYEVSRSFAQSLSLEATLHAVVETVVELLDVDAAVLRMPDGRGETLVTNAFHVADERLAEPIRAILTAPQPVAEAPERRLLRSGRPLVLDAAAAASLGGSYPLLVPFLEKGSTAAILPVSTQAEVLGTLTVVSLDPARPITGDAVDVAMSVAGHAALALDNARLYQQQKDFADAMHRSLLPRSHPQIEGLELGEVYAPSARVGVGGDVYDFMPLEDGRLAVVLGDVTGHGIDAAADMAMAKFVFRSLAREHSDPGDFLSAANEVVVGEVALSKFVTMLYLTIDPRTGELACACAGHPWPRVVAPGGAVSAIRAGGIALGIVPGQRYDEQRGELPAGGALVLYTDGVIEARHEGELYGDDRLDAVLAANAGVAPDALAKAVVADCRAFAGGDLGDDCAVVVVRRTLASVAGGASRPAEPTSGAA